MAYPPVLPPNNRGNTTPSFDNHPGDHNALVNAIADILAELGNDPGGAYASLTARLASISPVGAVTMFAANAVPTGWLLCNGSEQSRAGQAALFAVIGTAYGNGDGVTTFNLPNLKSRVPVGLDGAATIFNTLGKSGGVRDAVVPNHTHPIDHNHPSVPTTPQHQHGLPDGYTFFTRKAGAGALALTVAAGGEGWRDTAMTDFAQPNADVPAFVGPSGAAAGGVAPTDQNLQPYLVINYIIRAAA